MEYNKIDPNINMNSIYNPEKAADYLQNMLMFVPDKWCLQPDSGNIPCTMFPLLDLSLGCGKDLFL